MIKVRKVLSMLHKIKDDIHQMKKVSELIEYIPFHLLEKTAMFLLIIWAGSPFIYMVRSLFLERNDTLFIQMNYLVLSEGWYTLLLQVGFLGIITGVITMVKHYTKGKKLRGLFFGSNMHLVGLLLLLMLIWSVFSTFFSENLRLSLYGTFHRKDGLLTFFAYGGIFTAGLLVTKKRYKKCLLEVFAFGAFVLSLMMLINNPVINGLFSLDPKSTVFYNINHFGYYQCLALMVIAAQIYDENASKKILMIRFISFSVLTVGLIQNGSFGPYLASLLGMIFLIATTKTLKPGKMKRAIQLFAVFILLSVAVNFQTGNLQQEFSFLYNDANQIIQGEETLHKAGTNRWGLWMSGLKFTSERPIFGYGPENLGNRYREEYEDLDWYYSDRPHNEIIQFSASLGIPAAMAYIGAVVLFFYTVWLKGKKNTALQLAISVAMITYLLSSMLGNTMYYTTPFFFMVWGLAMDLEEAKINIRKRSGFL